MNNMNIYIQQPKFHHPPNSKYEILHVIISPHNREHYLSLSLGKHHITNRFNIHMSESDLRLFKPSRL